MNEESMSDRMLLRANALEEWLERAKSKYHLMPARLCGYGFLAGLLMVSNLFAILRWPIVSLLKRSRAQETRTAQTNAPPAPGIPTAVDSGGLAELIGSGRPVLVDFWAAWCGPCILMDDSLRRVAQDLGETCLVAKVDTMKHEPLTEAHKVRGLPTLILFNEGEEVARHAGALSYVGLRAWIERYVPARSA